MKIAFIGLGIMGKAMATNLLKHNCEVIVFNRTLAAAKTLEKEGAIIAHNIKESVEDADLVFSMLSTPEVVRTLFLSEEGALLHLKKDAIWVDCTTVNPSFSKETHQRASDLGIRFLEAPVAGTKPHAENAQLTFFTGGSDQIIDEVEGYLLLMGQKVLRLGGPGMGSSFKMIVNILLAQSMIIFSEATLLGEKMGLDRDFLLNTLPNLVVSAPFTKVKSEMIRANNYNVQFPLEWMLKDLNLATATAQEIEQPLFMANLAKELFNKANQEGYSRLDFSAIHRYLDHSN